MADASGGTEGDRRWAYRLSLRDIGNGDIKQNNIKGND